MLCATAARADLKVSRAGGPGDGRLWGAAHQIHNLRLGWLCSPICSLCSMSDSAVILISCSCSLECSGPESCRVDLSCSATVRLCLAVKLLVCTLGRQRWAMACTLWHMRLHFLAAILHRPYCEGNFKSSFQQACW